MTIYRPFFPSQTIDEEVVALILYRLVEQYDSNKPKKTSNKCRTGTATTKNHFGPPDIWNGPMKNLSKGFEWSIQMFSLFQITYRGW